MTTKPCVMVTGGSGYVGGHICKALRQADYFPINVDRQETTWSSKWGPFYKTDFTKLTEVNDVCNAYKREKYNAIAVVHCAANSLVGPSVSDQKLYYENNEIGIEHAFVTFDDGNVEAVMAVFKYKDGKIIHQETGATKTSK